MSETRNAWMIIVNPKAGMGYGLRDWPVICNGLFERNIEFSCVFTERKFHAVELTIGAIRTGYRNIVIVGGDGTVNEVINGLFMQQFCKPDEVTIAVIPVGTGNDWVRMLGIPKTYTGAVNAIETKKTIMQDISKITFYETKVMHTRYMANVAGIGFDASVNRVFNRLKDDGKTGKLLYYWSVVQAFLPYRAKHFTVRLDGKEIFSRKLFSGTIGVGKYNGGGMLQLPNAVFNDGLLDLTLIRKLSKYRVIVNFKRLYNGTLYLLNKVTAYQGKFIEIESAADSPIEIDGEACGYAPFTFEILPQAIKVVVGEQFLMKNV